MKPSTAPSTISLRRARGACRDRVGRRRQRAVVDHHACFAIVHDVADFLGRQVEVDRCEPDAGPQRGEIRLDECRSIPRHERHRIAGTDAVRAQQARELVDPCIEFAQTSGRRTVTPPPTCWGIATRRARRPSLAAPPVRARPANRRSLHRLPAPSRSPSLPARRSSQIASSTARASPRKTAHPQPLLALVEHDPVQKIDRTRRLDAQPQQSIAHQIQRHVVRHAHVELRALERRFELRRDHAPTSFAARSAGIITSAARRRQTTARETRPDPSRPSSRDTSASDRVRRTRRALRSDDAASLDRPRRHDPSGSVERFRRSVPRDSHSRAPTDSSAALFRNSRANARPSSVSGFSRS